MIPLAVRSHYSLMRGVASPHALCRRARLLGYGGLALTDRDNLYGLWPFINACAEEDITPIIGAEITDPAGLGSAFCLAENAEGYRNLCRVLTKRLRDPAFDFKKTLAENSHGLAILASHDELLIYLHEREISVVAALPRRANTANARRRRLASRLGLKSVAAVDSFFLDEKDHELHLLLRAIACNTSISRLPPAETMEVDAWLAPSATYETRFEVWPETLRASHEIAERCAFAGPKFGTVMPPYGNREGAAKEELREAAYQGACRRYGSDLPEEVVDRLERELKIIEQMGFSSYFLVVRDITQNSSRTCGRGSGAASLVAYCLYITNVCPMKHNLYFERFLNPGRLDPPDIDVDFAWDERDALLARVLEEHRGRAAMVANHVFFQPRMAIRETAKVYGLADAEIGKITKRVPWGKYFASEEELMPQLAREPSLKDAEFPAPWPEILKQARRLVGIPRCLSVHPGGVIITPAPIDEYAPVETAAKGVPIIQWEKDAAEQAGLVKIDLLGNRSLAVIRDAIANVRDNKIPFDEDNWQPEDDQKTQAAVARGLTMGCFYIESPAMRLLQQKIGKGDFGSLVIHSSIIRPAANEFIREYIKRSRGGAWAPIHPLLGDVLEETCGIMVYQEDVSRAAVALAGFSHAQADGLRKIMSKKDRANKLGDYKSMFFEGAGKNGLAPEQMEEIWRMMLSFEGYSFCKAHSASYAKVSFQAAFLKTHFPAEFMAAVISNQGGFYSTFAYVSEARRMGIKILPPDVRESNIRWQGQKSQLRVGLMAVSQLSQAAMDRIIDGRNINNFASAADFFSRVQPSESEARALIHAGALDSFAAPGGRSALLWEFLDRQRARSAALTLNLFNERPPPPVFPKEDGTTRLNQEFETLGFLTDRHPMTLYRYGLKGKKVLRVIDLPKFIGRKVVAAGWLITGKAVQTKKGEDMEFLTFEDETGIMETIFFPQAFSRYCHMFFGGAPFLLWGKVEEEYGALTLVVDRVERLV